MWHSMPEAQKPQSLASCRLQRDAVSPGPTTQHAHGPHDTRLTGLFQS
jgi:hypothetical protein